MKTNSFVSVSLYALALCLVAGGARAADRSRAEREAHLKLADIDREILVEQYRQLRHQAFELSLETKLRRIELKHAGPSDQAEGDAERQLAMQEERLQLVEELIANRRDQLVHLLAEMTELEAAATRPPHGRALEGTWVGREVEEGVAVKLKVEGEHARLECPDEDVWYEGTFEVEPEGEELLEVTFRIEACAEDQYRGKSSRGLARLSEGRLTLAANEPGNAARPSTLQAGPGIRVFVFERE